MNQQSGEEVETFCNKGNHQNYAQKYYHQNRRNHQTFKPTTPVHYNNRQQRLQTQHNKNLCNKNGTHLQCYICQSIYHMTQQCSEKRDTYYTQKVVLYQSDFDHPDKLKNLVSETWNAAVLNKGATNLVAGKIWFNCSINSLNSEKKSKIQHHVGTNIYQLGDGNLVQAVENVELPIAMGGKHVMLNTDIVASDNL